MVKVEYIVKCIQCGFVMDKIIVEESHVKRWELAGDAGQGSCVDCGCGA